MSTASWLATARGGPAHATAHEERAPRADQRAGRGRPISPRSSLVRSATMKLSSLCSRTCSTSKVTEEAQLDVAHVFLADALRSSPVAVAAPTPGNGSVSATARPRRAPPSSISACCLAGGGAGGVPHRRWRRRRPTRSSSGRSCGERFLHGSALGRRTSGGRRVAHGHSEVHSEEVLPDAEEIAVGDCRPLPGWRRTYCSWTSRGPNGATWEEVIRFLRMALRAGGKGKGRR